MLSVVLYCDCMYVCYVMIFGLWLLATRKLLPVDTIGNR